MADIDLKPDDFSSDAFGSLEDMNSPEKIADRTKQLISSISSNLGTNKSKLFSDIPSPKKETSPQEVVVKNTLQENPNSLANATLRSTAKWEALMRPTKSTSEPKENPNSFANAMLRTIARWEAVQQGLPDPSLKKKKNRFAFKEAQQNLPSSKAVSSSQQPSSGNPVLADKGTGQRPSILVIPSGQKNVVVVPPAGSGLPITLPPPQTSIPSVPSEKQQKQSPPIVNVQAPTAPAPVIDNKPDDFTPDAFSAPGKLTNSVFATPSPVRPSQFSDVGSASATPVTGNTPPVTQKVVSSSQPNQPPIVNVNVNVPTPSQPKQVWDVGSSSATPVTGSHVLGAKATSTPQTPPLQRLPSPTASIPPPPVRPSQFSDVGSASTTPVTGSHAPGAKATPSPNQNQPPPYKPTVSQNTPGFPGFIQSLKDMTNSFRNSNFGQATGINKTTPIHTVPTKEELEAQQVAKIAHMRTSLLGALGDANSAMGTPSDGSTSAGSAFGAVNKLAGIRGTDAGGTEKAIEAIAKFGEVTIASLNQLKKWNEELYQANIRFAEFSGAMAGVEASSEVRQMMLARERGDRRADWAGEHAEAKDRLSRSIAPAEDAWDKIKGTILTKLSDWSARVVEGTTKTVEYMGKIVGLMEESKKHDEEYDSNIIDLMNKIAPEDWDPAMGTRPARFPFAGGMRTKGGDSR